jgi:alkylation response protein AidB-like acyl-CoA dehydrogenase
MIIFELFVLLAVVLTCLFVKCNKYISTLAIVATLLVISIYGYTPFYLFSLYWLVFLAVTIFLLVKNVRMQFLSKPMFAYFKKALPPISQTEQAAIEAGNTWWEADLFQGKPDWQKLSKINITELTEKEQQFLSKQTETLCTMLDDWNIVREHDMPKQVWEYLKTEKFFGLVIEEKYGGLGFSALAHSAVVAKIASRSLSAAINTMVPNSLGPGELLHRYGTEQQKQYYLPRLANGEEVPCFALTSLDAGSDAGAMIDYGEVCKQHIDGKDVLGIKLNVNKRYITLAPVATIAGLAFKLYDPNKLLGNKTELGITLALVATNTPGIHIGERHLPMNLAFMNGPISAKNVFIEMHQIIGGQEGIGKGWRMLMECLSIGRSISLPALSTATAQLAYRTTGAYAYIREQFRTPIGRFEGISEPLAAIAGSTYILNASRLMTCSAVDSGCNPAIVSAIAKYHSTDTARQVMDHAMDIHAGRAVQSGPNNYLALAYCAMPVAITVEGANILTRNLIIFGQGAIRCHPYILNEMQAVKQGDKVAFDKLLIRHIAYTTSNLVRTVVHGLTNAVLAKAIAEPALKKYSKQIVRMSAALAAVSDIAMLVLGGNLKRKESLSARLGDVLSNLYLATAVIKYYQQRGKKDSDLFHVRWAIESQLANIQVAFDGFFDNFPNQWIARVLRWLVFPWGRSYARPSNHLNILLAEQTMRAGGLRDQLTELCYIGNAQQPVAVMDAALKAKYAIEPAFKKVRQAIKDKIIQEHYDQELVIKDAVVADVITEQEAKQIQSYQQLRITALAVDQFSADYFDKGQL